MYAHSDIGSRHCLHRHRNTHTLIETNQEPISYLSIWQFCHVAKFNSEGEYVADFAEGSATKEISYTFPRNQVKSLEINREINRNHMKSIKKSLEIDQKSDV